MEEIIKKVEHLYQVARLANVSADVHEQTLKTAQSLVEDIKKLAEPKTDGEANTKKK